MSEIKTKIENGVTMYLCEEDGKWYPEITTETLGSGKEAYQMDYKLDLRTWTYLPQLKLADNEEEERLLQQPIGYFGKKWQEFMTENYPGRRLGLELSLRWLIIPRLIDKEAEEMRETLEANYKKQNPMPETYWEKAEYIKTMQQENLSIIMRELVLQVRS